VGVSFTAVRVGAVTDIDTDLVRPPAAKTDTVVSVATGSVVTVKLAVVAPPATVTVVGTDAASTSGVKADDLAAIGRRAAQGHGTLHRLPAHGDGRTGGEGDARHVAGRGQAE